MKKLRTEKGFAMILVLFLAVIFSTVIAGDFLSLTRHQRSVQLSSDRVRNSWVNEALLDYTLRLFSQFVKTKGAYPDVKDSSACSNQIEDADCEVYDRLPGESGELSFSHKLWCWWNGGCDDQEGIKAAFGDITLTEDSIKIRQTEGTGDAMDPVRKYTIRFRTERAATGLKMAINHIISVSAGKMTDFFSFANGDLEICPGPNFDLEGPIFSNGDVYLMTTPGSGGWFGTPSSTLTLKVPEGIPETSPEYYALRAAGRIHFYYKPAVGRNYLLCDHLESGVCSPRAAIFRSLYPNFYRTEYAASIECGSSNLLGGICDLGSGPFNWNQLYPGFTTTVNWFGWTQDPTDKRFLGIERFHNGFPMMYHFRNDINYYWKESQLGSSNLFKVKIGSQTLSIVPHKLEYFVPMIFYGNYEYTAYFNQDRYSSSGFMNSSSAMNVTDPAKYPGLAYTDLDHDPSTPDEWSPTTPMTDNSYAIANPLWKTNNPAPEYFDDGYDPKTIPIGAIGGDPHLLIEPRDENDSEDVRSQKLWYKAHVQFRCNPSDGCRTHEIYIYNGNNGENNYGYVKKSSLGSYFVESVSELCDWRLGGCYQALNIDVGELTKYLNDFVSQGGQLDVRGAAFKGFIVYLETAPAPYSANSDTRIALVKLWNGAGVLPEDGLSIVTNGRLWVEGNYNTRVPTGVLSIPYWDLSASQYLNYWEIKSYELPAAGIFSDSFGILSGSGKYSFPNVTDRTVANDVMVNAAVISGHLPSQLEEAYPYCNGNNFLDPTKCFAYMPYAKYTTNNWRGNATFLNSYNTCYDANGFPKSECPGLPNHKNRERNNTTGIYYYRSIYLMTRNIYEAMYEEYYGYEPGVEYGGLDFIGPDAFAGCLNREAEWRNTPCSSASPLCVGGKVDLTNAAFGYSCSAPPNLIAGHDYSNRSPDPVTAPGLYHLYKNYETDEYKHWSDVPIEYMNELKTRINDGTYERHYKIPVEMWVEGWSGSWKLQCCATPPCSVTGVTHNCEPNEIPQNVKWREFDLSFKTISEVSQYAKGDSDWKIKRFPYFSTANVFCRGISPPPAYGADTTGLPDGSAIPWYKNGRSFFGGRNRPVEFNHCGVEPAPLLGGMYLTKYLDKTRYVGSALGEDISYGKFDYVANQGFSSNISLSGTCAESMRGFPCTGSTISTVGSPPGPLLRASTAYMQYDKEEAGTNPLYIPRYSGGLENFINLQENWDTSNIWRGTKKTLRFGGILTIAWDSRELEFSTSNTTQGKAYWNTSYYSAPIRKAQYDVFLKDKPPPGMPGVYSLRRLQIQELDPDDESVLG